MSTVWQPCVPCVFMKNCRLGSLKPLCAASTLLLLPAITHQFLLSRPGFINNHKLHGAGVRHTWYVMAGSSLPHCRAPACVRPVQANSALIPYCTAGHSEPPDSRKSCLFSRLCKYSHQHIVLVPFLPLSTCWAPAWALFITSLWITGAAPPAISQDHAIIPPLFLLLLC